MQIRDQYGRLLFGKEEEEERRRHRVENHRERQEFATKLTSEFVGKKLAKIYEDGGFLYIEFEDGSKLSIEPQDFEDYQAWVIVNNLSFRGPRY